MDKEPDRKRAKVIQPSFDVTEQKAPHIPEILPHEKVYTILVGDKKFKLSGASLSYDSPSYFTDFFTNNENTTTLSIDRSSKVFEKICTHLQGYSISIDDEYEFVYLLLDANYFRLKKLKERVLLEPFRVSIGGKQFILPKELMSMKGNHPNFFSVIYNSILLDPYAKNEIMIRPPPMHPYIVKKSPKIFEELLTGLYGNSIEIKNEKHRADLIADCRYYQFFALEQKLINHTILKNPFTGREEIVLGYKDIKKSGLLNDSITDKVVDESNIPYTIIKYSRPFVDENIYRDLIIQLDSSEVNLMVNASLRFINLLITGKVAVTLKNLLSKVTDDYIYENEGSSHKLTILIRMADSVGQLNGLKMEQGWLDTLMNAHNNKTGGSSSDVSDSKNSTVTKDEIIVVKLLQSQWTVNVYGRDKIWMNGLKFNGVLDESHFNAQREFL